MEPEPHYEDFRSLRRKIFDWEGEQCSGQEKQQHDAYVLRYCCEFLTDLAVYASTISSCLGPRTSGCRKYEPTVSLRY